MSTTQPFNPREFHDVAVQITAHSQSEACLRSAINRMYFAAFWLARTKTGIPPKPPKRGSHAEVITQLKKRGFRTEADQLDKLRALRVAADYDLMPDEPMDRDWLRNWQKATNLIASLLVRL
jgi:hypothetical protein